MSEFESADEYGYPEETEAYQELWDSLLDLTEAVSYVESVRTPPTGPLNIEATADAVGIPVTFSADIAGHAMIRGLDTEAEPIEVLVHDNDYEKALSFSHEIGHYLLYLTGQHQRRSPVVEEGFCEYFGRILSMPEVNDTTKDILTGEFVEGVCDEYQVSPRSFMSWLMEKGVLPERVIVDTRNPVTPNLDYSQVVKRHIVCLACEYGGCSRPGSPYDSTLPILDFTDRELSYSFTFAHNFFTKPNDAEFKYLQELYGQP